MLKKRCSSFENSTDKRSYIYRFKKMSLLFLKFWITLQIITRRGYQSKSKACKTPASILHVRAPYRLILVGVGVDPIGIFRKQDYSSKKIDTRGGGRDGERGTLGTRWINERRYVHRIFQSLRLFRQQWNATCFFMYSGYSGPPYWPPCLQNALCTRAKYGAKV